MDSFIGGVGGRETNARKTTRNPRNAVRAAYGSFGVGSARVVAAVAWRRLGSCATGAKRFRV